MCCVRKVLILKRERVSVQSVLPASMLIRRGCRVFLCDIGYTSLNGSTSESQCFRKCAAGMYAPLGNIDTCLPCERGKYIDAISFDCTSCPAGKISQSNSPNCTLCVPGKFQEKSDRFECDLCPQDTHSTAYGATSCTACPSEPEETGTNKTIGNTACMNKALYEPCPDGKILNLTAGKCVACDKGTYQIGNACKPCDPGRYSESEGLSECTECPAGKYSTTEGAASEDTCTECPMETYNSFSGQTACNSCPAGQQCNAMGLEEGIDCEAGSYALKRGSSCDSCAAVGTKHLKERLNVILVYQVNSGPSTVVLQKMTVRCVLPEDLHLQMACLSVLYVASPSINHWKGSLRVWSVRMLAR